MKIPKKTKRFCPKCKTHQEVAVTQSKKRGRSKAKPLSRGSNSRLRKRGERRGYGNLGRYSKPTKPKRTGAKVSKKVDLRFVCKKCGKSIVQNQGIRMKKVEIVAKEQ